MKAGVTVEGTVRLTPVHLMCVCVCRHACFLDLTVISIGITKPIISVSKTEVNNCI